MSPKCKFFRTEPISCGSVVNAFAKQAALRDSLAPSSRFREKQEADMARRGTGFFDRKGQFHKTPEEATRSDLAAMLGKIGDGESLAPGIAHTLLERREDIEELFSEHDAMCANCGDAENAADNVTRLKA